MARILVLEDDIQFNKVLRELLEDEGHEVVCAFSGREGLNLFEQDRPDLVITDILMPDMDGVQFLFSILDEEKSFPCKVITISGGGSGHIKPVLDIAKALGAVATFTKPLDMDDLLAAVREASP